MCKVELRYSEKMEMLSEKILLVVYKLSILITNCYGFERSRRVFWHALVL
jgi:hypothetical protein